jgi:hypothetical protein
MAETPEGPMPGREKSEAKAKMPTVWKYYKAPEYDAVVELVKILRGLGIIMHAKCPKCGAEGSVSVLTHRGHSYVIFRHPDKSTHVMPRQQVGDVLRELCEVKKDIEYVIERFKKYEQMGIKFCADAKEGQ